MPERAETVAILCGGRGTRLQERTHAIPKALVEIGGRPIVWHVIRIYAAHGFRRFLLLTGYRGEMIAEFCAADRWPDGVAVECLDTGVDTPTGGRVARAATSLGEGTFALTYADGVADIDLGEALDFHRSHGAAATVTVVRPRSQWGVAMIGPDDEISGFVEKPLMEQWVNAGFLFLEPRALAELGEDSVLERGAARAARRRRRAARVPPSGLLGLHGHLQGRGPAQRPLGRGVAAVADLGHGGGPLTA